MGAFFCFSLYGQGYPTSPVSPYLIPFYQDFRKHHDLSVFREFYPLEMSRLNAGKADLPDKHAVFGILPGYQYRSGEDDIASFDFWLSGKMNNITVMAEPVFVSDPFGQSILGTDYVRMNASGRVNNAFIRYYGENFSAQTFFDISSNPLSPLKVLNHGFFLSLSLNNLDAKDRKSVV